MCTDTPFSAPPTQGPETPWSQAVIPHPDSHGTLTRASPGHFLPAEPHSQGTPELGFRATVTKTVSKGSESECPPFGHGCRHGPVISALQHLLHLVDFACTPSYLWWH